MCGVTAVCASCTRAAARLVEDKDVGALDLLAHELHHLPSAFPGLGRAEVGALLQLVPLLKLLLLRCGAVSADKPVIIQHANPARMANAVALQAASMRVRAAMAACPWQLVHSSRRQKRGPVHRSDHRMELGTWDASAPVGEGQQRRSWRRWCAGVGRWRTAGGGRQAAGGRWRAASGGRRAVGGCGSRTGGALVQQLAAPSSACGCETSALRRLSRTCKRRRGGLSGHRHTLPQSRAPHLSRLRHARRLDHDVVPWNTPLT